MIGITSKIEEHKLKTELSYREALIDFCEDRNLDPSEVIHEVNKTLKQKIEAEFISLGMVKGGRPENLNKIDEWI